MNSSFPLHQLASPKVIIQQVLLSQRAADDIKLDDKSSISNHFWYTERIKLISWFMHGIYQNNSQLQWHLKWWALTWSLHSSVYVCCYSFSLETLLTIRKENYSFAFSKDVDSSNTKVQQSQFIIQGRIVLLLLNSG